ncbi:ABC transporter substrate-binding protein [Cryobacterium sp. Y11]|uniref:ABC transporter substrate-binding protein n=1 Tax=Cryobacterium sp. Y11 TaxID=2045016 RepID=UPI001304866F|nr:ABC transporter substrate-binding protein [Cryobacterium sp. Y11]
MTRSNRKFPFIRSLGVIAVAALALTSCAATPAGQDSETVSIDFWTTQQGEYKAELAAFTALHPDITVNPSFMGDYDEMQQKVLAGIVGGTVPQVVQLGQRYGIPQVADSGSLLPIGDILSPETIEDILPAFLERFTYKDKLWTVPFQSSTPVMYYNKTLFDSMGLVPPQTWDELVSTATTLTTPDVWGFNTAADIPWYFQPMTWNRGGELLDGSGEVALDSPEAIATLTSFQDLIYTSKAMPQNQHATAKEDFIGGRLAMLFASGSGLAGTQEQVGDAFEVGVAYIPGISEGEARSVPIGGNSLGIFASTPEQEEASAELVEFLTNTENSAAGSISSGYIAIRSSSLELPKFQKHLEDNPEFKVTIDQLEYLRGQAVSPADSLIWKGIIDAFESIETDPAADPAELLGALQSEVSDYLAEYRK